MAKILVVDDEPNLVRAFALILEAAGFETATAETGGEALRLARELGPDVILLDMVLPDISGLDVCREICDGDGAGLPFVVMMSGTRTSSEMQTAGLEAGAAGFLTKPIDAKVLVAQVRSLVRMKEVERALVESEERYRLQSEELSAANERLEEYNRLKAEFVANMSHELRTPLNAIIGFAQLMQMDMGGQRLSPPHADAIDRILRNSRHLLDLIDGVLDLSKVEAGRPLINPQHVDIVDTVQSAFAELQSLADRKGIGYSLTVRDELPGGFTDPLRVRQVVINLISNAIKFTSTGSVQVELASLGDEYWRFVVTDTGIGIGEEQLGYIFERFRQVDGSFTRRAGGAGLGLTIAQEIVKQLGGWIEVDSTFGVGSAFTVIAPFVAPAESTEPPVRQTPARTRPDAASDAPLVLVIEDDRDAATLLTATLTNAGYQVEVATDGRAGLDLALELQPAAITLDIMMPQVDGWRVLQELKRDPRTSGIPIVVCSIVDNRPLGYRLGAADYLVKPVEPQRIVETLEDVGAAPGDQGGYILVVDDERAVRDLLRTALKHAGYVARPAASGEAALRLATKSPPRAVLCDLMMPGGMSGFELIARLRANPETEQTPIVVVTGKDLTPQDRHLMGGEIAEIVRKGDLALPDLAKRVGQMLNEIGVSPSDGNDSYY